VCNTIPRIFPVSVILAFR
jgi:hypothetical protein